ncbi:hypothetical protein [Streptomyces sp. NPDC006368]
MGAGLILWVHGLIAVAKAVGHYRWAVRPVTATPVGGAPGAGARR